MAFAEAGTRFADMRYSSMIKIKPEKTPEAAKNTSTEQIAKNAVKGGPKDVKKDKRPAGGGQKG